MFTRLINFFYRLIGSRRVRVFAGTSYVLHSAHTGKNRVVKSLAERKYHEVVLAKTEAANNALVSIQDGYGPEHLYKA